MSFGFPEIVVHPGLSVILMMFGALYFLFSISRSLHRIAAVMEKKP